MNAPSRPTLIEIDLAALSHDLQQIRVFCDSGQGVLAVVKADAYGHGAVEISRALEREGVEQFAVATLEEGQELRAAGVKRPVLVLGGCYPGQETEFIRQELTPVVFCLEDLQRLELYAVEHGIRLGVHVKCDTGMGRVGFLSPEIPALIDSLKSARGIELLGLMSHLACADELGSVATEVQIRNFRGLLGEMKAAGISPGEIHLSNSAGLSAWDLPESTLVRPGIMLYGGYPSDEFSSRLDLRQVMTFSTRIVQLRNIEPGCGISYGHTFVTRRASRLATLPVGYADGYSRLLSNAGEVLIRGKRVPVVGRVCMDWILADVTDVEDVAVGDRVVLLGSDGAEEIRAEEWAAKVGSVNYEVFCGISRRVPRVLIARPADV